MMLVVMIVVLINTALLAVLFLRDKERAWGSLGNQISGIEKNQERLERLLREEISKGRAEAGANFQKAREEQSEHLNAFSNAVLSRMTEVSTLHKNQLDSFIQQLSALTQMNEQKLEKLREVVEERLKHLQEDNSQKLEKMRETVDEKLHSTLERRLGESFQIVSERLEKVHQGLGDMQNLATGVGDLKKVLSNVKTRGILGEVILENLLEQILIPEQYEKNVVIKKDSREAVEFAIKFSGRDHPVVYLPIDSKFPTEDFEKLQQAQEHVDLVMIEEAAKALVNRLKGEAKKIRDKYIDPPRTTDFAIMFLSTEGLFAEVLRRPGLFESMQRDYKITVAGPTTLAAILNSLQMGFRTLAVEKRASEVWNLLGTVKTEFGKFGDLLEKTQEKLQQASNNIEDAARKSRTIEKKLKDVQVLPSMAEKPLLGENGAEDLYELTHDDTAV
ncbi:MAG TPA: DNA recombination protein RmuC [Candidatus Omnitrophica bacterium]|nr:MAG: recombinase RmuC [Omnitrophica WOR_2 bacterium GWA2_45_18]OGX18393.1 MAG: recombinase RmuC [Omnitrophica WOR_2 bacterium GWC2_45_7]HBR14866.1 DNA recombination protein RmuC [Candidatus Omnitrophota bacterium]